MKDVNEWQMVTKDEQIKCKKQVLYCKLGINLKLFKNLKSN